ncbi:hypothetical protein HY571_00510 [Candidatus Micrarchaeota archaeon]|nr:hypothetical protein [Candidatus Micrarchaeota archaeon]
MEIIFDEDAVHDLDEMDNSIREFFRKHIKKISHMPPRRHLQLGLPWHVEEVTKQARLVYNYKNEEKLAIMRCFTTHKEYEKWYKTYF